MVIMGFHFFKIIVSDRWGKNWRRARHGGYFTVHGKDKGHFDLSIFDEVRKSSQL